MRYELIEYAMMSILEWNRGFPRVGGTGPEGVEGALGRAIMYYTRTGFIDDSHM